MHGMATDHPGYRPPLQPEWQDSSGLESSPLAAQLRTGTCFPSDIVASLQRECIGFFCAQFDWNEPVHTTLRVADVDVVGATFSAQWCDRRPAGVWTEVSVNVSFVLNTLRALGARGTAAGNSAGGIRTLDLVEALYGRGNTPALRAREAICTDSLRYFLTNDWAKSPGTSPNYDDMYSMDYWLGLFEGIRNWLLVNHQQRQY
jgi:hypothetical protein